MSKKYDVLTFGDVCVDMILTDENIEPEFGQKEKIIADYDVQMGGSCLIYACQCAKLGLKTAVIGKAGQDAFGDIVCGTLSKSGVSMELMQRTSQMKTGVTVALNKGNDRAMLTYNGTIHGVLPSDAAPEILAQTRHFHIGSYFLMEQLLESYPHFLKILKENGATISLDTNWDPTEQWDSGIMKVLPFVDLFFPNEQEVLNITKKKDVESAIAYVAEMVPVVAVKKGGDGACVYANGKVYQAEPLRVNVKDTVGAGDTFDAGFTYAWLSGKPVEECARIACICGSMSTQAFGGTGGQLTACELEEMLDKKNCQ